LHMVGQRAPDPMRGRVRCARAKYSAYCGNSP
jgi:hypothetical protein